MSLPKGRLTSRKVELSGGEVEVHGLSFDQSRIAAELEGVDRIICALSFGTGTPKGDVEAWLADAPAGDAYKLLDVIMELSKMAVAEAQFPQ